MITIISTEQEDNDFLFLITELARRIRNETEMYPQEWLTERGDYDDN